MKLSLSTLDQLDVAKPDYALQSLPISVVHFGPGAFFRAHQAYYFDQLNKTDPRFGICGVSMHSTSVSEALSAQDGLYVLSQLDNVTKYQVIGSLRELCLANRDRVHVMNRLSAPETLYVTSTITEKGYCLGADGILDVNHPDIAHDIAAPQAPISYLGFVNLGLKARFDKAIRPYVVLCCDNLADNGRKVRAAILALAERTFPEMVDWLKHNLLCPNTMVDSITPATTDELRATVLAKTGIEDAWPIQREAFTQWVIETHDYSGAPNWNGLGINLTDDVAAFEKAKLWLLNGTHSTLAYAGYLKGYVSVSQAMTDIHLKALIETMMSEDILPLLIGPKGVDLSIYAAAIRQRYENKAIVHNLSQIAWDGSQKLPIRILEPLTMAMQQGRDISRFCFCIAAWMRFIVAMTRSNLPIIDPLKTQLQALGEAARDDAKDVLSFLTLRAVFSPNLIQSKIFITALTKAYEALLIQEHRALA